MKMSSVCRRMIPIHWESEIRKSQERCILPAEVVRFFRQAHIPEQIDHLKPVFDLELPVDVGHVIPNGSDRDEQLSLDVFI